MGSVRAQQFFRICDATSTLLHDQHLAINLQKADYSPHYRWSTSERASKVVLLRRMIAARTSPSRSVPCRASCNELTKLNESVTCHFVLGLATNVHQA